MSACLIIPYPLITHHKHTTFSAIIKKVAVFVVLSKNNDNYYYIPVTKIDNSKKDKIKIIIDELRR